MARRLMNDRREFLKSTALLTALLACSNRTFAVVSKVERPFDFAWLKGQARSLAGRPFKQLPKVLPQHLVDLSYDEYQALRFRRDHALWAQEDRGFHVEFFHMGRGF